MKDEGCEFFSKVKILAYEKEKQKDTANPLKKRTNERHFVIRPNLKNITFSFKKINKETNEKRPNKHQSQLKDKTNKL